MLTYEGLRLKLLNYWRIGLADYRRKQLKSTDFTIISNNCWGGMIYESYNLPKQTPTVGMFFMAKDYIEFLSDLKGYIEGKLTFIQPEDSRWKDYEEVGGDKRFGTYPIGLLSNGKNTVEIFFLHYDNEKEAYDKWMRRIKRINWKRILVKFNDQNGCTKRDLKQFNNLPYANKIFFTCNKWSNFPNKNGIYIKQFPKSKTIRASYEPFGKNSKVNITKILNSL